MLATDAEVDAQVDAVVAFHGGVLRMLLANRFLALRANLERHCVANEALAEWCIRN
jgi:hypothetical protein